MATIKARRQANGSIRYTAIVRKRVGKTIVHREAKTFTHLSAAVSWAKHREVTLENPSALTRVHQDTPTLEVPHAAAKRTGLFAEDRSPSCVTL